MTRTTLRAEFLFPGNGEVLRDPWLAIEGERIVECRAAARGTPAGVDLGHAAIVPPLVNAHTHLEFSDRAEPIAAGATFAEWLSAVISERTSSRQRDSESHMAIHQGLAESRRFGCLTLGEIATTTNETAAPDGPVSGLQFLELIGTSPDRVAKQLKMARGFLESRQRPAADGFRPALSPHAPYSTSMQLVEATVALAREYDVPVAMHLAETQEELQLLARQDGPLADFLNERRIWPPPHLSPGTSVMDYLRLLATAPRALVIHGNFLTAEERAFVANQPQMSIVYCPRTHAHFGHRKYPLAETLAAGARVALGTDSCASNPDLNIWADAQRVARQHPDVSPAKVLDLITTDAAEALGNSPPRLQIGQPASFAVIAGLPAASPERQDPFAELLAMETYPAKVWLRGQEIPLE